MSHSIVHYELFHVFPAVLYVDTLLRCFIQLTAIEVVKVKVFIVVTEMAAVVYG